MKKFTITIIALILVALLSLGLFKIINQNTIKNENNEEISTQIDNTTKEILDIKDNESTTLEEKKYSEEYKKYLELPNEEKKEIEVIPREEEIPLTDLENIKEKEEIVSEIPKNFDLRNTIDIKVENQLSYGLCWAFASLKTLETNLWLHEGKNYDLSEIHIDYLTSNLMYGNREIHSGGSFGTFKDYSIISGATLEEDGEYKELNQTEYNLLLNRESVAIVTETIDFPTINKYSNNYNEEELKEFRDVIKTHIMKNGAIYAAIGSPYWLNNNSYYCDNNCFRNGRHAVAIIGWDDNYSKEKFKSESGIKPKNDGAYIAINSWGDYWGENGYFYISYEDMEVEREMSGVLSTSIKDAYKINDIKNEHIKNIITEKLNYSFINYNGEDYVTKNALKKIYQLDLKDQNLTSNDIEELYIFENLSNLNLSNNNIEDISSLTKIKKLYLLNLANNNIKDVTPLKKIENLTTLDLSNNLNIKGYGELTNLTTLTLNNCNIIELEDLSNLNNLFNLNLSNNKKISNYESIPTNIEILTLNNCEITNLEILNKFTNLRILDISNNNLTTLNDLRNIDFLQLYQIDISNNPNLIDYNVLKDIKNLNTIIAKNNNITDITIFNNIKITELDLSYNQITNISEFESKSIYKLNLTGNKNLTGLSSIKDINIVILSNCNIDNLNEIILLENVNTLDLSYNQITDITPLNELTNLNALSLAGNKTISGELSNNIDSLNISNTELESFNISKLPNLCILNISNNKNFKNIEEIINNDLLEHLNIEMENVVISNDIVEKLDATKITLNNPIIEYKLEQAENEIELNNEWLKSFLMKHILSGNLNIKNGQISKNIKIINKLNKETEIEINLPYYYYKGVLSPTIKLTYNS